MKYLLDTTWIVEYLRGNQEVVARMQALEAQGLGVSIISVAELYEGVYRSSSRERNQQALHNVLGVVSVLEITEEVARTYGEIKADLVKKGTVIGALDLLIAATALAHGLVLLTFDQDFHRVEGLTIGQV
jgi:tRNA(fMet)-specific endonuclease VapC